jgi:Fe-S oxidoreductase
MFVIPLNMALETSRPRGSLKRPDLEALINSGAENFTLGVTSLLDTTWKQRLDHDTCIECGRCDNNCPANQAGKQLSPMSIILNQRNLARQASALPHGSSEQQALMGKPLVGEIIPAISLWECRTCYACVEVCPVGIDHLDHIVELRRSEVLMKGEMPAEAQTMLRALETRGNPLGSQDDRVSWISKAGFKVLKPGEKVEFLYWIGCATTFDPRKQKVAHDLVKILEHAGISYGVLGEKEMCTGDPARLVGDENIFQTQAKSQLAMIDATQFDTMVVNCPHCYNAFDNEYPQFGAKFKVIHHTELLERLVQQGKLKLNANLARKITYHDPCYLGRVQDVYDQPRSLLEAVSGSKPIELSRNRQKSACCGAGGGHFWMDLKEGGERLDNRRVDEVAASGANTLGVGCVFCMQMLENGLKARDLDKKIAVKDVVELVAESLFQNQSV